MFQEYKSKRGIRQVGMLLRAKLVERLFNPYPAVGMRPQHEACVMCPVEALNFFIDAEPALLVMSFFFFFSPGFGISQVGQWSGTPQLLAWSSGLGICTLVLVAP